MKRILLLSFTFLFCVSCAWAQLGRGQQFQNNNFENWMQYSYGSFITRYYYLPDHWNSLKNANGDWSGATSVVLFKENGSPSGSGQYCAKMQSTSIMGVTANGGMSNGRFNAGATDATDTKNCTYTNTGTDPEDASFRTSLTSKPDSIYFWAKTNISSSTSSQGRCNVVIHNNVVTSGASDNAAYQDPNPSSASHSVVNTDGNGNNAKVVAMATSNFLSNNTWSYRKIAFDYDSYAINNTSPSYILATFSTSDTPGGGTAGDELYIDDVVLIYNTRLATLNVNGIGISGFNADVTTYNINMCAGDAFPTITFTTQSPRATGTITHAATTSEPYTTIRVNHYNQDNIVYTDYTINYTVNPLPAAPTVASSTINKCESVGIALSATAAASCNVKWYDAATGGNLLFTGSNYATTTNTNTTYYVSSYNNTSGCESSSRTAINVVVNPKPGVPSVSGVSRCGAGEVTLNATPGANGSSCQWYTSATGGSSLGSATSYTIPSLSATTTYYVSSVSEYGCESDRTGITATINTLPQAATVTPASRCGAGIVTLSANAGEGGNQCRWYAAAEGGEVLSTDNTFTTPSIENTTTYYVSSYNTTTGCESSSRTAVTATIKSIPEAPVPNQGTRCGEGAVTLSVTPNATPCTYNWYDGEGEGAQLLAYNTESYTTSSISSTTTYYVDATNNGCTSTRSAVQAIVNSLPTAPTAQNQTLCGPGNTTITAQPAESCECRWYNASHNAITTGISEDSKSLSVNNINTTSIYYATSLNTTTQCASAETAITITVADVPGNATVSGRSRCGEGAITLSAVAGSNANTCRWYDSSATLLYTGTDYNIENLAQTTRYTVKSYNTETACEGSERGVIATINAIPAEPTVTGMQSICGNGTTTLQGTAGSNANNCQWILGNDTTTALNFTTANLTAPQSISYTVRSINTSTRCASEGLSITVSANQNPTAAVTGNDSQCLGTTVNLSANSEGDHTVCRWYSDVELHNLVFTGNNYQRNDLPVGSTNFYVQVLDTTTQCVSGSSTSTATMIAAPAMPNANDMSNCGAASFTLSVINPDTEHNTYNWYNVAEGGTAISHDVNFSTGTLNDTTYYYLSANAAGFSCESPRKKVSVYVNPVPAAPAITGNEAICAGNSLNLHANLDANADVCQWISESGTTTGLDFNTGILNANASYNVKAVNSISHCESELTTVNVTVNALPEAPVATSDAQCQGEEVTLHANSGTNEQCRWYASAESSDILSSNNDFHPSNLSVGTTNFYVSIYNTSTSCEGSRSMVQATIYPTYNVEDEATACDSYTWNGETFNTTGNYTRTLHSILNCDSVVTLHLTINNSKQTHIDTTVCDLFVWNGANYTVSNPNLVDTFTTSKGCDSIVSINLTVKHKTYANDSRVVCSNELPFDYNGTSITAAGNYTITITNAQGCDSVISLAVTVNAQPALATNLIPAARCGAGNITLSANPGANGLTCRWYDSETAETPCAADGNQLILNNLQETKTYYVSSYNAYAANGHACESGRSAIIATINTIPAQPVIANEHRCGAGEVTFAANIDENATTCRWYPTATAATADATGLNYTVNISNMDEAESFFAESYNESTGCKSTRVEVTATAHVIPSAPVLAPMSYCGPHSFSISAPAVGTYKWYDNATSEEVLGIVDNTTPELSSSRSYFISNTINYIDIACESTRGELALTIHPVYAAQNLYDTLCQGETYTQHGLHETFNQAGSFDRTLSTVSSHGCDSVVTLHLWVKEIKTYARNHTACDSYTWNGETYNQSGSYTQTFTSSLGCDSVVTLQLTINQSKIHSFSATACDTYQWNEVTYTESGDYNQVFSTSLGCDSTVTLHLTINNSKHTDLNEIACDRYVWNGQVYTESGTYNQSFRTTHNCDSTVSLHLTVNYSDTTYIDDEICNGETYMLHNFNVTPSTTGLNIFAHLDQKVATGCDSTTILRLQVNPVYNQQVYQTICETALPYTWNDITYPIGTASGEYTHTYRTHTAANCDSVITLNLTISNKYITHLSADICQGESYSFGGRSLTESGTYYDSLHAHNLCDSIVELQLRVHELHTTNLAGEICLGESYQQYGFNITPENAGVSNHQRIVQTTFGCDSTINLTLTTHPVYAYLNETGTTCDDAAYVWQGHDVEIGLKAAGTYIIWDSLTTIHGCDSVYKLTLTVNPSYNHHFDTTVCDVFVWNGNTYTQSETLSHTYTLATGCDSTVNINLTVNHSKTTVIDTTVCDDFIFPWEPVQTYTQSISKSHTYQTVLGCDSLVTINATINHSVKDTVYETICQSELPYTWRGHTFEIGTTSGQHIYSEQTYLACDSTVWFNLTVNPTYFHPETATTCDNQAYVWAGHDVEIGLLPAGNYIYWDSLSTVSGCDSIYKLELSVNATSTSAFDAEICEGEVYRYNGRAYSESGDYPVHFNNIAGCDSTVTLHLTVHPRFEADTTVTICEGALPYTFADSVFTGAGSKDVKLQTIHGCDSIYHVTLHVNSFITHTQSASVCDNELPYILGDSAFYTSGNYTVIETHDDGCNVYTYLTLTVNQTYEYTETEVACGSYTLTRGTSTRVLTQSGIYSDTLQTIHGCDSIIHLNLTINPLKDSTLTPAICLGSSYTENGFNITPTESGIVLDTLSTTCAGTGCDSTVYLILTVNPSYNHSFDTTVCDVFVWNNTTYTTSDVLTHTYPLATGCDSIVTINLTVNYSAVTNIDTTVCNEFVWNGTTYTQSALLNDVFTTSKGCDSTVNINLTVNYSATTNIDTSVCNEFVWNGTTYTQSALLNDVFITSKGCDSTVNINLTVNYSATTNIDTIVCDEFVWNGTTYTQSALLNDVFTTSRGCDSTVNINLTVNYSTTTNIDTTVCDEFVFPWSSTVYTESTSQTHTYSTALGCDSTVTINATINHSVTETAEATICQSQLPYTWRDTTFYAGSVSNIYTFHRQTYLGCDSTVTLNLTINPSNEYTDNTIYFCQGSYTYWRGQQIAVAGLYTDTVDNEYGCYDVYKVTAIQNPSYSFTERDTICPSELPYTWRGNNYSAAGTYDINYYTSQQCDSIYVLQLTVRESYMFNDTDAVCEGVNYVWPGHERISIGMKAPGTHVIWDSLATAFGCDSLYRLTLTVYPSAHEIEQASNCSNEAPYQWHGMSIAMTGTYRDTLETVNGCDSICELRFTLLEPTNNVLYDTTCENHAYSYAGFEWTLPTAGDTTMVRIINNSVGCDSTITLHLNVIPTIMNSFDTISCTSFTWNTQTYFESGDYQQTFTAYNGCDSVVTLNLTIDTPEIDTVYATSCDVYEWHGTNYTQSGVYNKTFPQEVGCANISYLVLTINNSAETIIRDTICQGDHYQAWGFDTIPINAGITRAEQHLSTVNGCDSLVKLELVVKITYIEPTIASTCDNQPYQWRGHVCDTTGIYIDQYEAVNHCDSIFALYLTVYPTYSQDVTDTAVVGVHYTGYGMDFTPTTPGTQVYNIPEVTIHDCDSIINLTLVVVGGSGIEQVYLNHAISLYPNPTEDQFTVSSTAGDITEISVFDNSGRLVMKRTVNDRQAKVDVTELAAGMYIVRVRTADGIANKKVIVR